MKIFMLIETEKGRVTIGNESFNEECSRDIKPVAMKEEALRWTEQTAKEKHAQLNKYNPTTLTQIRNSSNEITGYRVSDGDTKFIFTFTEYILDISTPCEKTQKAIAYPKLSNDLEIIQAYDHVATCSKCQQFALSTYHVSGNFDLQEKINFIRGGAP